MLHGGNVFHSLSFYFGFLITILVIVRLDTLLPTHDIICLVRNSLEMLCYFLMSFSLGL